MRALAALTTLCLVCPILFAQPEPSLKQLDDQYKQGLKRVRNALVKDIETLYDAVRRGPGKPEAKVALRNQLSKEKEAFLDKNELPTSDLMLRPTLKYLLAVRKARQPLSKGYSKAIAKALKGNDQKAANDLVAKKAALDKEAGGLGKFAEGSRWDGARHGVNKAVTFHLNVKKFDGGTFRGEVWINNGGVGMEVAGETEGNAITFQTVMMLRGDNRKLVFTGFVFGDRILAEISGTATNGWPAQGIVVLRAN